MTHKSVISFLKYVIKTHSQILFIHISTTFFHNKSKLKLICVPQIQRNRILTILFEIILFFDII